MFPYRQEEAVMPAVDERVTIGPSWTDMLPGDVRENNLGTTAGYALISRHQTYLS